MKRPALLVIVIAAGCVRPRWELSVDNVHTVTPGVLVRGVQTDEHAGLVALRRAFGVVTVVNFDGRTADSERALAVRLGLHYVAMPASPFRPRKAQVVAFIDTVRAANDGPVYVHCEPGMDRTGYAVAAYRVLVDCWTADRALRESRDYQTSLHASAFAEIPAFVRAVEANRSSWLAALAQPVVFTQPEEIR